MDPHESRESASDDTSNATDSLPQSSAPRRSLAAIRAGQQNEFAERLAELTPRTWVTPSIVGVNALVFLAMVASGVDVLMPDVEAMVRWGADWGPATSGGEPWRMLTSTFLHFGVVHLAVNMWVLWSAGLVTERLFGNVSYLAIYLLAGLGGSALSLAWHPHVVSAGASGAVFGVYGALLAFVHIGADQLPKSVVARLRKSGLGFIAYNALLGLSIPGIDHAGHMGGLIAGYLVGRLLVRPLAKSETPPPIPRSRITAAIGIVVLSCIAALYLGGRNGTRKDFEIFDSGRDALAAEDYTLAIERFTEALRQAPGLAESYYNRAIAHQALGDFEAAREDLLRFIEVFPDDADAQELLEQLDAALNE